MVHNQKLTGHWIDLNDAGLAQEQVDAMAPAISHLQGLEVYHSSAAQSACGLAAVVDKNPTPESNFKLSMPYDMRMETPAAESPAVSAAYAAAGVTADDFSTLGLLRSQYGAEAAAVVSREPSKGKISSNVEQQGVISMQQQR